jgi:hypothetical protein
MQLKRRINGHNTLEELSQETHGVKNRYDFEMKSR